METRKKQQKKIPKVTKPYLQGDPVDKTLFSRTIKFFFSTIGMVLAFVLVGGMMNWGNAILNGVFNGMIIVTMGLMFYQFGTTAGAEAVNQGEIMYQRRETGRTVDPAEQKLCFHPWKGMIYALLGSLPLVLASLVLACIAQKQMTPMGTLPSWIGALETRPEIGAPLTFYHDVPSMSLEDTLRIIIRMSTMPYLNIIGSANRDGMLLLERISPILNLIPAVVYGLGYMCGVQVRSKVHTDIALGKKKQKRKQQKERRARSARQPEKLN